jgi:hypothetical protein
MGNEQTKSLPTYRVYTVTDGENATWTEIGAAWPHKDRKGFNLTFTAQPLPGAKLVLRMPKTNTEKSASVRKAARAAKTEIAA